MHAWVPFVPCVTLCFEFLSLSLSLRYTLVCVCIRRLLGRLSLSCTTRDKRGENRGRGREGDLCGSEGRRRCKWRRAREHSYNSSGRVTGQNPSVKDRHVWSKMCTKIIEKSRNEASRLPPAGNLATVLHTVMSPYNVLQTFSAVMAII